MDESADVFPQPCVTVTILNAYTFRTAIEMVEDIRDGDMEIRFFPDRIVIEEFSKDERKFCKISIKKKDLYTYRYSPFVLNDDEDLPECFSVTVNTNEFVESIKCDKKQKVLFEVFCSTSSTNCAICFSRDRAGDSMDRINGRYDFYCGVESRTEDPFQAVYKSMEPNSILNEKALGENLTLFKYKKPVYAIFSLTDRGTIEISSTNGSRATAVELPPNLNYVAENEHIVNENDKGSYVENAYEISLQYKDIVELGKIVKLGPNNVIKIYMSLDYPLVIRTRLLNYGIFTIWYTNPPNC